jgi:cobalt-zinc-cadmium efflux system outer membrane protein
MVPRFPSCDLVRFAGRAARACALLATIGTAVGAEASPATAQSAAQLTSLSRDSAVSLALAHGSRAAIAGANARSALAHVREAGSLANPLLSASYSKDVPQYHASIDFPLDFLTLRGLRVASARSASEAAQLRLAFERAAIRLDVDTSYTIAVARRARAALSRRNASDADSLQVVADVRRSAGDASDLDVDVARISAGRERNAAAADSEAAVAALLDLQQALGMTAAAPSVGALDSLDVPALDTSTPALASQTGGATPLPVAAAQYDLRAADQALALEHRSVWSGLALQAGIENHDPTGAETGILPTFGVSIPLPLFNQGGGSIAVAEAERDRARVELAAAERESAALLARARRELQSASARVTRDRQLVETANRVARLSLRAYAEGEYPLTTVLEAQRNARDTLSALIDDLVAANIAASALRLYSGTVDR